MDWNKVISKDTVKMPYTKDGYAEAGYMKAIEKLRELEKQGRLTFECDPVVIPYVWHNISIKWNLEDEWLVVMEINELLQIIGNMQGAELSLPQKDGSDWLITTTIYCPS